MSLIDEALKKTQSALNPHQAQPLSHAPIYTNPVYHYQPDSDYSPPPPPKNKIFFKKMHLMVLGFLFSLSIILLVHRYVFAFFTIEKNFYQNTWHHFFHPMKPVIKPLPLPPLPALTLNGTLQIKKEHVALINHQLLHEGEFIEGFQVKRIDYDDVDLINPTTHQKMVLNTLL